MSSSKKKISDQIPRPMTIKKEKSEEDRTLQPISHYIDDRLELVKQIFGTLKPKTIMNLAPEFLKKTSLDEIEELCLNELLCISTKRLKSIIADTRCPTDTESSEDSDVEHKQEHVSLEEISSDSDIGGSEKRRAKKLRKSSAKKTDKTSGNNEPSGQISVLELLELQARARAIRSQLAMEPITKIEVKSDDDDDEQPQVKQRDKEKRSSHRNSNASKQKSDEQATSKQINKELAQTQANGGNAKPTTAPAKKIKLKRNYRTSTKSPERKIESNPPAANVSKPEEVNKEQPKSRSASPDVIPIAAEPETLLISDSTDDEAHPAPKQQKEATPIEVAPPPAAAPAQPAEESEPEEGEVRDEPETVTETQTEPITVEKEKPAETELEKQEDPIEKSAPAEEIAVEPEEPVSHPTVPDTSSIVDDEDQNDDVISIGGDLEMIEELSQVDDEPAVKVKSEAPVKLAVPDEEDNDVISLNTSDDDTEKLQEDSSESWRTRYLKSSKVSQVLAASRLGKRVRDKIKKSNRAQKRNESKDAANEKAIQQQKQEQEQQFTSKHEDGSMEQYKELLQHRQRKSSNSSSSRGDK